jgi:hypothetical protein
MEVSLCSYPITVSPLIDISMYVCIYICIQGGSKPCNQTLEGSINYSVDLCRLTAS